MGCASLLEKDDAVNRGAPGLALRSPRQGGDESVGHEGSPAQLSADLKPLPQRVVRYESLPFRPNRRQALD